MRKKLNKFIKIRAKRVSGSENIEKEKRYDR